eukprot:CAMPEP_0197181800 /NCGR_PEP_ID=MMETSP1423-20130617/5973_1 /TAXON_ID=476441 /ORGANISM="Pseudo-nitzschia heimii, Strain UNC1101" /LENGTH=319 /DNA_ID=CAMNT_0042632115 /DNA_START=209 /DNA_END=1168 /DNA_ORIENTATION=+
MGNQPSNGGVPGGHHSHNPGDDPRRHSSNNRGGSSSYSVYNGGNAGYPSSGTGGATAASGIGGQHQQQQKALIRSNSDASMTGGGNTDADATVKVGNVAVENWLDDDTVPTVFRWEHGGRQVYITGTFNGWSRQIPMHRSGNDFTYIHNLKRGKHAFKFIVDDEWRFAPDQPTVADIEGRINNFIDVTDFKPYTGDREFEKEKAAAEYGFIADEEEAPATQSKDGDGTGPDRDGEVFSQTMPDMDEYTKEPPPLPPHLRHIILNKPPQLQDTAALPVPQHVALNHLYCTAIKDNMMVLGITQRYKTKFVTTVYYSPCAK